MGSIALQVIDSGHLPQKILEQEMDAKLFVLLISSAAVMSASVIDPRSSDSPSSSAAPSPSSSAAPNPSSSVTPTQSSAAPTTSGSAAPTTAGTDTTTTTAGATTGFISTTIIAACVLSKL